MWLFNLLFSSLSQLWYVEVRISRSVSVSPLEFEITRVDCTGHRHNIFVPVNTNSTSVEINCRTGDLRMATRTRRRKHYNTTDGLFFKTCLHPANTSRRKHDNTTVGLFVMSCFRLANTTRRKRYRKTDGLFVMSCFRPANMSRRKHDITTDGLLSCRVSASPTRQDENTHNRWLICHDTTW